MKVKRKAKNRAGLPVLAICPWPPKKRGLTKAKKGGKGEG
jgi:hypothetical protein